MSGSGSEEMFDRAAAAAKFGVDECDLREGVEVLPNGVLYPIKAIRLFELGQYLVEFRGFGKWCNKWKSRDWLVRTCGQAVRDFDRARNPGTPLHVLFPGRYTPEGDLIQDAEPLPPEITAVEAPLNLSLCPSPPHCPCTRPLPTGQVTMMPGLSISSTQGWQKSPNPGWQSPPLCFPCLPPLRPTELTAWPSRPHQQLASSLSLLPPCSNEVLSAGLSLWAWHLPCRRRKVSSSVLSASNTSCKTNSPSLNDGPPGPSLPVALHAVEMYPTFSQQRATPASRTRALQNSRQPVPLMPLALPMQHDQHLAANPQHNRGFVMHLARPGPSQAVDSIMQRALDAPQPVRVSQRCLLS